MNIGEVKLNRYVTALPPGYTVVADNADKGFVTAMGPDGKLVIIQKQIAPEAKASREAAVKVADASDNVFRKRASDAPPAVRTAKLNKPAVPVTVPTASKHPSPAAVPAVKTSKPNKQTVPMVAPPTTAPKRASVSAPPPAPAAPAKPAADKSASQMPTANEANLVMVPDFQTVKKPFIKAWDWAFGSNKPESKPADHKPLESKPSSPTQTVKPSLLMPTSDSASDKHAKPAKNAKPVKPALVLMSASNSTSDKPVKQSKPAQPIKPAQPAQAVPVPKARPALPSDKNADVKKDKHIKRHARPLSRMGRNAQDMAEASYNSQVTSREGAIKQQADEAGIDAYKASYDYTDKPAIEAKYANLLKKRTAEARSKSDSYNQQLINEAVQRYNDSVASAKKTYSDSVVMAHKVRNVLEQDCKNLEAQIPEAKKAEMRAEWKKLNDDKLKRDLSDAQAKLKRDLDAAEARKKQDIGEKGNSGEAKKKADALFSDIMNEDSKKPNEGFWARVGSGFSTAVGQRGVNQEIEKAKNDELRKARQVAEDKKRNARDNTLKVVSAVSEDTTDMAFLNAIDANTSGWCYHTSKEALRSGGLTGGKLLDGGSANDAVKFLSTNPAFTAVNLAQDPKKALEFIKNPPAGTILVYLHGHSSQYWENGHISTIIANETVPFKDKKGRVIRNEKLILESSDNTKEYMLNNPAFLNQIMKIATDADGKPLKDKDGKVIKIIDPEQIAAFVPVSQDLKDPRVQAERKRLIQNVPAYVDALTEKLRVTSDPKQKAILNLELARLNKIEDQHQSVIFKDQPKVLQNIPTQIEKLIGELKNANDGYKTAIQIRINRLQFFENKYHNLLFNKDNEKLLQNIPASIDKMIGILKNPEINDDYRDAVIRRLEVLEKTESKNHDFIFNSEHTSLLSNLPTDINKMIQEYKKSDDDDYKAILQRRIKTLEDTEFSQFDSIYNKNHGGLLKGIPADIQKLLNEYKNSDDNGYKEIIRTRFGHLIAIEGNKFYSLYKNHRNLSNVSTESFLQQAKFVSKELTNPDITDPDYRKMLWGQFGMLIHILETINPEKHADKSEQYNGAPGGRINYLLNKYAAM